MKKTLQYLKNYKTKPDTKLYEEDIDIIIKRKKRRILAFEYIEKSFDRLCHNLDEYRDVQKEITTTLVYIVEIIE